MFPVAYQATLDIIKEREDAGDRTPSGVVHGSENLAKAGVRDLYLAGHKKMALKYYLQLRERFPKKKDYKQTLDAFIRQQMKLAIEDIGPKEASNSINSFLRDGYVSYALYDDDNAAIKEEYARQIHKRYSMEFEDEKTDRMRMPSLAQMRQEAMMDFFNDPCD